MLTYFVWNIRNEHREIRIKTQLLLSTEGVSSQWRIWAPWRLRSPATRVFVQHFVRADITENQRFLLLALCEGNPPVTGWFPSQRTSNAESASIFWRHHVKVFSCDQAALWMVQSVRPSVRLSVRPSVRLSVTPFWLCSHHPIIMKFSGVITSDKSDVHAKGQGQRSKVKVTEVTTQLNRFRTVTPVWIHIWWWNDAYSLIMLRRGALLFFKVIRQISRSHGSKKRRIWPRLGVSGL